MVNARVVQVQRGLPHANSWGLKTPMFRKTRFGLRSVCSLKISINNVALGMSDSILVWSVGA